MLSMPRGRCVRGVQPASQHPRMTGQVALPLWMFLLLSGGINYDRTLEDRTATGPPAGCGAPECVGGRGRK